MNCWGPNLFWHGCYNVQILDPQVLVYFDNLNKDNNLRPSEGKILLGCISLRNSEIAIKYKYDTADDIMLSCIALFTIHDLNVQLPAILIGK